jgi:hypothetical protein
MDTTQLHKIWMRSFTMRRRPILGLLVALITSGGFAQPSCSARTPEQALPPGWIEATNHATLESSGSVYRLSRIVVDPELHRRWALIANCTHPERPLEIVALSRGHVIVPTQAAKPFPLPPFSPGLARHSVPTEVAPGSAILSPSNVSVPTAAVLAKSSATVPLIRAGDLVRLWSSDANVRLEMEVVSLEYGRAGQVIHLRRVGQTALLAGVVVDKDSAELIP